MRLWLGETSVGKKRPSASAVDAAVGSLQKVSISFQGGDSPTGKPGQASRRGSLDRNAGAHHPNGDDVDKEDNADVTDDEDEAGLCTDQRELARLALYWTLGKMDLILGVVLLGVAMWVRAKMLLSDDPRKKKTVGDEENAWRWMLFVACILLGASNEPDGTFRRRLSPASAPTHVFSWLGRKGTRIIRQSGSDGPSRLTSRPDTPPVNPPSQADSSRVGSSTPPSTPSTGSRATRRRTEHHPHL